MRTLSIALIVAALATLARAQVIKPGGLAAEVEVHVVNVDVSVTDRSGKPVLDLTKDDFEIFEDGKPQKVTNFAVIHGASPAPGTLTRTTQPQAAPERRRILLIVDNNYIGVIDRNKALDAIEKYLSDNSFDSDWALCSIGHTAEMVQSFTQDKTLIHAAFDRLRHMQSSEEAHKIDRSILSERMPYRPTLSEMVTSDENHKAKVQFSSREQTFRNLMTMENTARAVVDTARAYAAEDGKKFILLLTGGMEQNTTFSAFDNGDPELRELQQQTQVVTDAMVREANGANFTIDIINARPHGMAAPQHDVANRSSGTTNAGLLHDPGNNPIDVSNVDSIPLSIALGTGGVYLPSSDIHASLATIDELTSNYYSLGYSPDHSGDRQYHAISVKVKRHGVRVENRVGYFDETPEDRLEAMLRVRTKFDEGFGSIPVKVEVGKATEGEHDLILPVTSAMPLARVTVVPQDQNFAGRIHVYCSVFDENGRNVGFSHQAQKITMTADQVSSAGDFRYTMKVLLKPGTFTIVVTVRDELSNEIGSASEVVHL